VTIDRSLAPGGLDSITTRLPSDGAAASTPDIAVPSTSWWENKRRELRTPTASRLGTSIEVS
jgi:hypothetical protein